MNDATPFSKGGFSTGDRTPPQTTAHSWLEFDVEDVARATAVLKKRGHELLVESRKEPWGQTVTRMISPEGILIGITFTPWMR